MPLTSKPVTVNASWKTVPKFTDLLQHSIKEHTLMMLHLINETLKEIPGKNSPALKKRGQECMHKLLILEYDHNQKI